MTTRADVVCEICHEIDNVDFDARLLMSHKFDGVDQD